MKPHPRIRKTLKWGGALGTALLVAVWGGGAGRKGLISPNLGCCALVRGGFVGVYEK